MSNLYKILMTLNGGIRWLFKWAKTSYNTTDTIDFPAGGVCTTDGVQFTSLVTGTDIGYFSPNGISWEIFKLPKSGMWYRVRYGGGFFIAVEQYDPAEIQNSQIKTDEFLYSTDGKAWVIGKLPEKCVAISADSDGSSKWIVLDADGNIFYSSSINLTTATWTKQSIAHADITIKYPSLSQYYSDVKYSASAGLFFVICRRSHLFFVITPSDMNVVVAGDKATSNNWVTLIELKGVLRRFTANSFSASHILKKTGANWGYQASALNPVLKSFVVETVSNSKGVILKCDSTDGVFLYYTLDLTDPASFKEVVAVHPKTNFTSGSGFEYFGISDSKLVLYNSVTKKRLYSTKVSDVADFLTEASFLESPTDTIPDNFVASITAYNGSKWLTIRPNTDVMFTSANSITWTKSTVASFTKQSYVDLIGWAGYFIALTPSAIYISGDSAVTWGLRSGITLTDMRRIWRFHINSVEVFVIMTDTKLYYATGMLNTTVTLSELIVPNADAANKYVSLSANDKGEIIAGGTKGYTLVVPGISVTWYPESNATLAEVSTKDGTSVLAYNNTNVLKIVTKGVLTSKAVSILPTDKEVASLVAIADKFVMIYKNHNMSYISADGLTWISETLTDTDNWGRIGWNEDLVVVGNNKAVVAGCASQKVVYTIKP